MQISFSGKQPEGGNVWSFFFKPPTELSWKPGQYLYCTLKHQNQDNRGDRRYFTIASAPHEHLARFTIRYFGEKSSSFKQALFNLPEGATLEVYPPDGSFTLNNMSSMYLWIAGGIGITPFRSMASAFNENKSFPKTHLIYLNQTQDIIFGDELQELTERFPEFKMSPCIAPETVTESFIKNLVPDYKKRLAYVSGPEPMVKETTKFLQSMGFHKRSIKTDYFPGYTS